MGRTFNRRRNRFLKQMLELRVADPELFQHKVGMLLCQWQRQAQFRAGAFIYQDGQAVPKVWDLCCRKWQVAVELGIEDDLTEICRQAIARQIGSGQTKLGLASHLSIRDQIEDGTLQGIAAS